jgi:hypothetical protein
VIGAAIFDQNQGGGLLEITFHRHGRTALADRADYCMAAHHVQIFPNPIYYICTKIYEFAGKCIFLEIRNVCEKGRPRR